ncbi:MAG: thioredoxin-dependent thiol peroxidase [Bacteroidales bacterium]|jgi:peroxiredoxin Q/BCP|nr:thioredoxin-dependent thiol peroxidase [Bacteroidales bacterium]
MTQQPAEGLPAPYFEGIDQFDAMLKLTDFRGKKIALYFYPKDSTAGCTAEACSLRDSYGLLMAKGYVIIGVSPDSLKSHKKFAGKHELPFSIIADESKKILTDYGVWGEKQMYGRKYMGVLRTTFIIDENGIIDKIISKVNTSQHGKQILDL